MNILSVKDVYYKVDKLDIIKGISIDIKKDDCISIVGQSGSGKSTLLKLCADLIPITSGSIYYKEKCYTNYNPIELRKSISYCIQTPILFGNNVYDNLEFPFKIRNEKVDINRINYLLEKLNLDKSYLQKDIKTLSGGEKQRIAIIRNLLYIPEILLLDEITASLDKENTIIVENYIKELNESGVTVLWITHSDEQSKSIFNKRIFISQGEVIKVEEII
ncbi:ABC transporter ATP-binding protein [[Clostridium] dakarense]|uniref:ABC transporter ATP-binding protein n=1 Tax=Faecalimicrobium dakarense TaxID=1301100 RepID=UPI0004B8C63F|nr:ATP-binding cassette domain-containing protein [[Clostridium] dakarense]